jgi:hypothetical protein
MQSVYLEKLLVAQLAKKSPSLTLFWNRKFYYCGRNSLLDNAVNHLNAIHTIILSFFRIHFNMVPPSKLKVK